MWKLLTRWLKLGRQLPKEVRPLSFVEALDHELDEIANARQARGQHLNAGSGKGYERAHDANLVGLALSGSGTRSAAFNLGVIQALAHLEIFGIFDYLSTVSAGSYIGGWLTAGIKRADGNLRRFSWKLRQWPTWGGGESEDPSIRFLRRHVSDIDWQPSVFNFDSWTLASAYLRNLLLNLAILTSALASILLVPRLIIWFTRYGDRFFWHYLFAALCMTLVGIAFIGLNFRHLAGQKQRFPWYTSPQSVNLTVVLPLSLALIFLNFLLYALSSMKLVTGWQDSWWAWALCLGAVHALFFLVAALLAGGRGSSWLSLVAASPFAGAFGGFMLWLIFHAYSPVGPWASTWVSAAFVAGLGVPLLLVVFTAIGYLHLGLAGRGVRDAARDWFSRLGGWSLFCAMIWVLIFVVAIYGPFLLQQTHYWSKVILGSGWLLSTLFGVLLGKKAGVEVGRSKPILRFVVRLAPLVFILGFLIVVSSVIDIGIRNTGVGRQALATAKQAQSGIAAGSSGQSLPQHIVVPTADPNVSLRVPVEVVSPAQRPSNEFQQHLMIVGFAVDQPGTVWFWLACSFLIAFVLSQRVDINLFSMQSLYRNRLARCYLGASNAVRRPHPLTGFDPDDDLVLSSLMSSTAAQPYWGPFPIINASINLLDQQGLSGRQRKAAPFVFTPISSGFEIPESYSANEGGGCGGYRPTADYAFADGGIQLGTAMAISGSASRNLDYYSRSLNFLLNIFNLRLGAWFGNPAGKRWRQASPKAGLRYLLKDMFSRMDARSDFVYLSGGSYFEGLGIFELVKRRCRLVVVSDAGSDAKLMFQDLGNAIRRCRTELGIDIEINTEPVRLRDIGFSTWHCAIGKIRYDFVDRGAEVGTLVYLKPTLTGDEPADLLHYRTLHPEFPLGMSGDLLFDEARFESYRHLGLHITKQVFEGALRQSDDLDRSGQIGAHNEGVITALRERWTPASLAIKTHFTRHTAALDQIFERLRKDEKLRFLNVQIYPEWLSLMEHAVTPEAYPEVEHWLPSDAEEITQGFYFCNSLIQLMENVYLDLNLDQESDHPDNRGWLNLFKHWSWSGMFRVTWAISASTYGVRFQRFCERRLGLQLGEIRMETFSLSSDKLRTLGLKPNEYLDAMGLNPVEKKLISGLAAAPVSKIRSACTVSD